MKTVSVVMTLLVLMFVTPAFSAKEGGSSEADFEQKKADKLNKLDDRIAKLQADKTCYQEATTHEAFKDCQNKSKGERKEKKK